HLRFELEVREPELLEGIQVTTADICGHLPVEGGVEDSLRHPSAELERQRWIGADPGQESLLGLSITRERIVEFKARRDGDDSFENAAQLAGCLAQRWTQRTPTHVVRLRSTSVVPVVTTHRSSRPHVVCGRGPVALLVADLSAQHTT